MSEQVQQPETSCQSSAIIDPSQLQKLKNHYEEFVMGYDCCEVCLIKEGLNEDTLIICDLCDGLVHQSCYGGELLANIPENAWFCGRCRILVDDFLKKDGLLHPKDDKSLRCALCPEQKGIMKSIFWKNQNCTQLAHMGCVVSIKYLAFEDNLRSIVTKKYEPKRSRDECSICERKMGICGVCHKSGCSFSFHFSCGKRAGIIQDVTVMNTLIECREKRYNRSEPEHHITFCEEHLYELSYIEYPDDTFLKEFIQNMYIQRHIFETEKDNLSTLLLDYPICKGIQYSKRQLEVQYSSLARKKQKVLQNPKQQQIAATSTGSNKEQLDQESQASLKLDLQKSELNQKGVASHQEKLKQEDTKIIKKLMKNQIERRSRRQIENSSRHQEEGEDQIEDTIKEKLMVTNKKDNQSKRVEQIGKKQVEYTKKEENYSAQQQQTKKDKKYQEQKGINPAKKVCTNIAKESQQIQEGKNTKETKIEIDQDWQRIQKVLQILVKNEGKGDTNSGQRRLKNQQDEISNQMDSMEEQNMNDFDDCSILDIDEMIRQGLDHRQPDFNIPCDTDSQSNLDSSEDNQQNMTMELNKSSKTTDSSKNNGESQNDLAPQKDLFQLHSDLRESIKLTGPFPQRRWKKEIAIFFVKKHCLNPISREILIDKCTDKKAHFLIKVKNTNPQTNSAAAP